MTPRRWARLLFALQTLKRLDMPRDKEAIREVIQAEPKAIQRELMFFAARLFYRKTGVLYPISITVDTTLACNFACPGCYISEELIVPSKENIKKGNSVAEWQRRFKGLAAENPFLVHASWVGGEPTLRKNLLKAGIQHFRNNWVHTNGYLPLPTDLGDEYHRVTYMVSVDGYQEAHNRMRPTRGGQQPTYERVLTNIRGSQELNIMVHTVVSPGNIGTLSKLLDDLRATGKVQGVAFSILSPRHGSTLFSRHQRDAIIRQLLVYRRTYGRFFWSTPSILNRMRSDRINETYGAGCRIRVRHDGTGANIPLTVYGQVKEKCVMGPNQSCHDCGCAIPAQYAVLFEDTFRGELENTPVIGRLLDYTTRINK